MALPKWITDKAVRDADNAEWERVRPRGPDFLDFDDPRAGIHDMMVWGYAALVLFIALGATFEISEIHARRAALDAAFHQSK